MSTTHDAVDDRVLVIGAGVSGLTTALSLRRAGYAVTVVAESFAPGLTSNVAGALWEWPPAVCGYHHDQVSLERSKDWCMTSYDIFFDLARKPGTGVYIRPVIFFFRRPVAERPLNTRKMRELSGKVKGFRHDPAMIAEEGVNPNIGLVDAYTHLAPMVDTDVYLEWLRAEAERAGCVLRNERISGSLAAQEVHLLGRFGAAFIVNCAGLGARELTGESMFPLRGALVRLVNDGRQFPRIEKAYCVSFDEEMRQRDIVFIVPRGENTVVLGALVEEDEWNTEINLENYEPVREMFDRCREFLPMLAAAEPDEREPVRVGLRPCRPRNVRVEREPDRRIVHNYGHGGSGVTLSWGCAAEVVEIVHAFTGVRA
jgi:D-amino-acid oxidase